TVAIRSMRSAAAVGAAPSARLGAVADMGPDYRPRRLSRSLTLRHCVAGLLRRPLVLPGLERLGRPDQGVDVGAAGRPVQQVLGAGWVGDQAGRIARSPRPHLGGNGMAQ